MIGTQFCVILVLMSRPVRKPETVSIALVVENLKDVCTEVVDLTAELSAKRAERNRYIRESLDYIPMMRLVKITGLSREQLYKIKTAAGQQED